MLALLWQPATEVVLFIGSLLYAEIPLLLQLLLQSVYNRYSLHVRSVKCQIKSNGGWDIGTMCVSACVGHVCFCCPAKVVQPTRVGRYGEELPRSASQPASQPEWAGTSKERGGGVGRSAKAHIKQTGIMEKRSPLRRTLPSNGVRLLTSLLALYGLTCEYSVYLSFLSALTYFF